MYLFLFFSVTFLRMSLISRDIKLFLTLGNRYFLHRVLNLFTTDMHVSLPHTEKGFCVRGDLCPFDHGNDPLIVDDVNLPSMIPFPPPPVMPPAGLPMPPITEPPPPLRMPAMPPYGQPPPPGVFPMTGEYYHHISALMTTDIWNYMCLMWTVTFLVAFCWM